MTIIIKPMWVPFDAVLWCSKFYTHNISGKWVLPFSVRFYSCCCCSFFFFSFDGSFSLIGICIVCVLCVCVWHACDCKPMVLLLKPVFRVIANGYCLHHQIVFNVVWVEYHATETAIATASYSMQTTILPQFKLQIPYLRT